MIRGNRVFALLFFVVISTWLYYIGALSSSSTRTTNSYGAPAHGASKPHGAPQALNIGVNQTLCQYNECLEGRWVPREPRFATLEDFQAVFASRGSTKWSQCKVTDVPKGTTEEETRKLEEQRMVDIMNWVWKPNRGEQVPWDALDLVVRLLKTPGGLVFMGDSLTQGHDHAFGSYLQESGIEFDTNPPHLPVDSGIRSHVLKPDHPITRELQRRAGVPDSRMRFPIFNIIEEHLLLHEDELRDLVRPFGAREGWEWYLQSMKKADDYLAFFRWITESRPGEESSVTRDTILLLNTGAHWSRGTMGMLPEHDTYEKERAMITQVYSAMVKRVMDKFSPFKRLTIFYRATNAGHPSCHKFNAPISSSLAYVHFGSKAKFLELVDAQAKDTVDKKVRRRWDWDLFRTNSLSWRREIERLAEIDKARTAAKYKGTPVRVGKEGREGPKWFFVDFWDMTLQRPDAHSAPGHDCLHWCLPAIYNEWSRHIYHLIYLEMEQSR